jgi:hypothetical protein
MELEITRRTFLKILGIVIGRIMLFKILLNNNVSVGGASLNNFSTTIIHSLSDSDNGKSFVISNFPINCIIDKIMIRSNYVADNKRIWSVFVNNTNGVIPSDMIIPYRGTWDSSVIGEYVFIDNEMVLITADDGSNIIVKRGVKGTEPSYHDYNSVVRIEKKGLRLILFKNSGQKLSERLKILRNLMTWQGKTNSMIVLNDKFIRFSDSIENITKYDLLYLNDTLSSEIASVEDISNKANNGSFENTVFVAEPLFVHNTSIDVQKLIIIEELISYKGDNNLYGILYVDGSIDKEKYPDGITVDLEISII